jgi:hypothetical protein
MKSFRKWMPTAVLIVTGVLVLYYTGVLDSKTTVGVALTVMSVLIFLSVLLRPHGDE